MIYKNRRTWLTYLGWSARQLWGSCWGLFSCAGPAGRTGVTWCCPSWPSSSAWDCTGPAWVCPSWLPQKVLLLNQVALPGVQAKDGDSKVCSREKLYSRGGQERLGEHLRCTSLKVRGPRCLRDKETGWSEVWERWSEVRKRWSNWCSVQHIWVTCFFILCMFRKWQH